MRLQELQRCCYCLNLYKEHVCVRLIDNNKKRKNIHWGRQTHNVTRLVKLLNAPVGIMEMSFDAKFLSKQNKKEERERERNIETCWITRWKNKGFSYSYKIVAVLFWIVGIAVRPLRRHPISTCFVSQDGAASIRAVCIGTRESNDKRMNPFDDFWNNNNQKSSYHIISRCTQWAIVSILLLKLLF